jgi:hypothetical protein
MIDPPGLNWIERWAVRTLTRSPRVGMLVVKEFGSPLLYVARDRGDLVMPQEFDEPSEPAAHQFERMFHAPSYGESE